MPADRVESPWASRRYLRRLSREAPAQLSVVRIACEDRNYSSTGLEVVVQRAHADPPRRNAVVLADQLEQLRLDWIFHPRHRRLCPFVSLRLHLLHLGKPHHAGIGWTWLRLVPLAGFLA